MAAILTDTSPPTLVAAIEAAFVQYTVACVLAAGGEAHTEPSMTWVYGTNHLAYFNGVFQTTLSDADAPAAIEERLRFFAEQGRRMTWWVTPNSRPVNLPQLLAAHGMHETWRDTGMALDLSTLAPGAPPLAKGITVAPVANAAEFRDWLHAFGAGFDLPEGITQSYGAMLQSVPFGQHPVGPFFLARQAGEPVGTSALFTTAGVAGVYEVCTAPHARGQGIATALVLAALRQGMARGYRVGVIHASEMGERVYRRLGFRAYCTLAAYLREVE
ncbi:MAG: GNAT family N-acetyltransferase [Ktedonobacterales bacterium]|nr:GNAT family N-acetyltransferase [Ktedonobacterales bacterium]